MTGVSRAARCGLLACVAWLSALCLVACASERPGLTPGARIEGHGFAVLAPTGEGWTLVQRPPEAVVFGKRLPAAQSRHGDGPYLLLAGVQVLPVEAGEDFASNARQWLTRRLQVPGRQLVSLDVRVAPWQGAMCVQYDALQVDLYDFDDPATRFEYAHIGRRIGPREDNRFWLQLSSSGEIGVESKYDPRKLIPTELSQTELKWTDGEDKYEFNRYSGVLSASLAPRWATMRKWYDCKKIGGRLF